MSETVAMPLDQQEERDETAEQRMAFDLYYRMGNDRSLVKVAEQTGKHLNTIKLWSARFAWQERVAEREKATTLKREDVQDVLREQDLKKKHVKVLDVAITHGVREISEGRVKINNTRELIQVMDARWNLAAQPAPTTAMANMQFNGPTKVDLGLERMSREERMKFLEEMLQGIMRVQTRPPMGSTK
jgi:hypothetical protein